MKTSIEGKDLIKHFEGLHDGDLSTIGLQPKICPAGVWTEGWGHAMRHNGKQLKGIENKELAYSLTTIHTIAEADTQLDIDLEFYEYAIIKTVKVAIYQNQFDALVSFCYNVGDYNFKTSTLLKRLNDGKYNLAAEQFLRWTKANGKELPGLVRRRLAEKLLFEKKMNLNPLLDEVEQLAIARDFDIEQRWDFKS